MYVRFGMRNSMRKLGRGLVVALCLLQAFLVSSVAMVKSPRVFNWVLKQTNVTNHCSTQEVVTVNDMYPGPTARVREGDTVMVKVVNRCKYNATLHWHGVYQRHTGWSDGPEYITQCPIQPGAKYTYKFQITGQHGTLWWHAHASSLRATVFGAFIILPPQNFVYPYQKPKHEEILILGEWWDANIMELVTETHKNGDIFPESDSFNINGKPGNTYACSPVPPKNCSSLQKHKSRGRKGQAKPIDVALMEYASYLSLPDLSLPSGSMIPWTETTKIKVKKGEKVLLRIINAAVDTPFYAGVAKHNLTVVAVDGRYTQPYNTSYVVIDQGQTLDAVLTADQPCGSYYFAAQIWFTMTNFTNGNTTTALIEYEDCPVAEEVATPECPALPDIGDYNTVHKFHASLRGLDTSDVPIHLDEDMFIVTSVNIYPCDRHGHDTATSSEDSSSMAVRELVTVSQDQQQFKCLGPYGERYAASFNNVSFQFPSVSILNAYYFNISGVYTPDFPDRPPREYNYTEINRDRNQDWYTEKGTRVKKLRYNSTVQIVLQSSRLMVGESHPIHLHGHDFYVVGSGIGNFNATTDIAKFNLRDPVARNTANVPVNGWTAIRFVANNPGVWMMHCHLDFHQSVGMISVFITENSKENVAVLEDPPTDLPKC